jgi:transcriptional regulator with XRE-family HTH domain
MLHRDRVRNARQRRGWSQRGLASKCGWPQSKVSRIETGDHEKLTVGDLETIVSQFGLSMLDWYRGRA